MPDRDSGGEGSHEVPRSGVYVLLVRLGREAAITAGRRSEVRFPPGFYAYVGRAERGLPERLGRHARREGKRLHWHVDYLMEHAGAVEFWVLPLKSGECRTAVVLEQRGGSREGLEGFGASDCRCGGHLLYFGEVPPAPPQGIKRFSTRDVQRPPTAQSGGYR